MSETSSSAPLPFVELKFPVAFNGTTTTRVDFKRRPKARDSIDLGKRFKDPAEFQMQMLVTLTEVEPEVYREMDMADYSKVSSVLSDFLS